MSDDDLRTGRAPWTLQTLDHKKPHPTKSPLEADTVIIGAGITGAFLAERFTRGGGQGVLIVDRNQPNSASTSASTSLLQWEIDEPLSKLGQVIGPDNAAKVYRRCFESVQTIAGLIGSLSIDCAFHQRHTLYLQGESLPGSAFRDELDVRIKAGLPGALMNADAVARDYGFPPRAAIRSPGSAEADPVMLAHGLLSAAIGRGAQVYAPVDITHYDFSANGILLRSQEGMEFRCKRLLLATGYVMPDFIPKNGHKIISTYAMSTAPQPKNLIWPGCDLVWEAADPYFYMRTTEKGEMIIGGFDEDIHDAEERDALLLQKKQALSKLLKKLRPDADMASVKVWSAFFGTSEDSLPFIGSVPGVDSVYAAYGYGGNGITFSAMAADVIHRQTSGQRDDLSELFALDRKL